jgi:antirestriction protein ArdC
MRKRMRASCADVSRSRKLLRRLDRDLGRKRFADAAAFLCADLGITPETRDEYRVMAEKVLKDDKRAIFTAASHAQKAADYLHGLQPNPDTASAEDLQEAA